jgi:hypothetical protein
MKKVIVTILIIAVLMSIAPIEGRTPYSNEPVLVSQPIVRPYSSNQVTINQYADAKTVIGNAYTGNSVLVYQGGRGYSITPYYSRCYYGCINIVNIFQTSIAYSVYGDAIATNTATVRQMPPRRRP